jgi:regulator of replication initiation timing
MWDKIVEYGKQILSLTKRVEENATNIKELRGNLQELVSKVAELAISNNELKVRFAHLKETEESERDNLAREWQTYQEKYQQDQKIMLLELKNMFQSEQISRLSEKSDRTKLLGGEEQDA